MVEVLMFAIAFLTISGGRHSFSVSKFSGIFLCGMNNIQALFSFSIYVIIYKSHFAITRCFRVTTGVLNDRKNWVNFILAVIQLLAYLRIYIATFTF